jgi:heme A synthase
MLSESRARDRFRQYAWFVLVYDLPVILWGAVVRATVSGAGCNDHWPLCDGSALPAFGNTKLLIEYAHRASSGFVLLLTALLFWWALRVFPKGHTVRLGALLSLLFTVSEALIGAALVLFKLVAHDQSAYRAIAISAHLTNTFMLLASLTLTAWWASGGERVQVRGQGTVAGLLGGALLGAMIVGITGAITALGDTLFPVGSIAEIGAPVGPTAHFLQHLRVYHPYAAVGVGAFAVGAAWLVSAQRPSDAVKNLTFGVTLLFVTQVGVGFLNLFMRAPVPMQLAHLLLADGLWIVLVMLSAAACAVNAPRAVPVGRTRAGAETLEGTH